MKPVDIDQLDQLPGRRLGDNEPFTFRCHSGLDCYNRCCRNLNLFLYPYDVVRLKGRLGLSSDEFLDRHVDIVLRPESRFPEVLLRMKEDAEKTCAFLTDRGCSVYPDRPDTCRMFPMETGTYIPEGRNAPVLVRFFRPPEFCRGPAEDHRLTPVQYVRDQQAELYNRMTLKWADLRAGFQANPWGVEGVEGQKAKMVFMAAYNVDRFREFVFGSSFLNRYKVKAAVQKKIAAGDTELLNFAFHWIRLLLWGTKSDLIRPRR